MIFIVNTVVYIENRKILKFLQINVYVAKPHALKTKIIYILYTKRK